MTRLGKYWIFFVIVAVGLTLSWTQIGRKTQRLFENEPIIFLTTELSCHVTEAPCAALAADRAVVVGPAPTGLLVRQTGLSPEKIARMEAVFFSADGDETGRQLLARSAAAWPVAAVPTGSTLLRLRIVGDRQATVAEYPL
jgi:hypothetical protein